MKEDMPDFDDLSFVLINNPGTSPEMIDMLFRRIPRELFEQVKDVEFNIDLLYQYPSKFIGGATTRFYVLIDAEDKIKGILWASVNLLTEKIQISILSVEKEYQFSDAIEKTLEFIRSWQGENENLKIQIVTIEPQTYEKLGWKSSEQIILEV